MSWRWPVALTIAGSDSGGGAGIQADLKTFLDHGVFGASALVAITAQNTRGVQAVAGLAPALVRAQIHSVLSDLSVGAIKIGMLGTAELAGAVADALEAQDRLPPIVLDPVMVASSGDRLLQDDAVDVLARRLLPLAALATPNLAEATVLAGARADLEAWAAQAPCAILLTGGNETDPEVVDRYYQRGALQRTWRGPRLGQGSFHGTGCTLSSAVAARLAHGVAMEAAIEGAIAYVRSLIARSPGSVGQGQAVLPHGLI